MQTNENEMDDHNQSRNKQDIDEFIIKQVCARCMVSADIAKQALESSLWNAEIAINEINRKNRWREKEQFEKALNECSTISKSKISTVTSLAMKYVSRYKEIVYLIEQFIRTGKTLNNSKLPQLFIIDSICRAEAVKNLKYITGFGQNIDETYNALCRGPIADKLQIKRVFVLWHKQDWFPKDKMQQIISNINNPQQTVSSSNKHGQNLDKDSASVHPGDIPKFLQHIWAILQNSTLSHIISWHETFPNAFLVHDQRLFCKDVLPKYYKHNKFTSFVRQLNMYQFHKLRDEGSMTWSHPYLHKDKYNQLQYIQRRISSSSSPHFSHRCSSHIHQQQQSLNHYNHHSLNSIIDNPQIQKNQITVTKISDENKQRINLLQEGIEEFRDDIGKQFIKLKRELMSDIANLKANDRTQNIGNLDDNNNQYSVVLPKFDSNNTM